MIISMIFAWCSVLCALLAAFRYVARILKKPALNRFFHKIHIPTGILSLSFGLIHGLLAGNIPGDSVEIGSVFLSFNWGTLCFCLMVLLIINCHLKRLLKKKWMLLHRILTVVLIAVLSLHIIDMGVHIFDSIGDTSSSQSISDSQTDASSAPFSSQPTTTAETEVITIEPSSMSEKIKAEFSGAVLEDGIYTGSGEGHKGTITVEVTVEQGQVILITVLEQSETPKYFSRAEGVLDIIKQEQSLQVDAISGATYSSAGLIEAVENTLEGAVLEEKLKAKD